MENMAKRSFLISLTFNLAKVLGSSAKPRGLKASPGGNVCPARARRAPGALPFY